MKLKIKSEKLKIMDKLSELFTKTLKENPAGEEAVNARLLIRAGYIDKLMAGVYTILPLGLKVIKKIEQIIREEINAIGGQEIYMPTLHPKENWEVTGRWDQLDNDVYKTKDDSNREFMLASTHEEVIVPLAKKYLNSYKDLPFAAYQFQNKFRREKRAKSGLLRGREFIMKDLYSFHLDESDLDSYYEKAKKAYFNIFDRVGIGSQTYLTFASGGTFSKYSHEFQTVTPAGEDTIYICAKCSLAINEEIKPGLDACPDCGGKDFQEKKAIEVGNIFKNKEKYTGAFDLKVKNAQGKETLVLTGCYGIGLQRLMGTIVEVSHDDKGIIWTKGVTPYDVHCVQIQNSKVKIQNDNAKVKIEEITDQLNKAGLDVLIDDREDVSVGEKLSDADLVGIPWRIVISDKTLIQNGVEVKKRSAEKAEVVDIKTAIDIIKK